MSIDGSREQELKKHFVDLLSSLFNIDIDEEYYGNFNTLFGNIRFTDYTSAEAIVSAIIHEVIDTDHLSSLNFIMGLDPETPKWAAIARFTQGISKIDTFSEPSKSSSNSFKSALGSSNPYNQAYYHFTSGSSSSKPPPSQEFRVSYARAIHQLVSAESDDIRDMSPEEYNEIFESIFSNVQGETARDIGRGLYTFLDNVDESNVDFIGKIKKLVPDEYNTVPEQIAYLQKYIESAFSTNGLYVFGNLQNNYANEKKLGLWLDNEHEYDSYGEESVATSDGPVFTGLYLLFPRMHMDQSVGYLLQVCEEVVNLGVENTGILRDMTGYDEEHHPLSFKDMIKIVLSVLEDRIMTLMNARFDDFYNRVDGRRLGDNINHLQYIGNSMRLETESELEYKVLPRSRSEKVKYKDVL